MTENVELSGLKVLLTSWDLLHLLPHFQDEGINIEELQLMKSHHISELLRNFKLGVRVRFEHHFEKWRRNLNKPIQSDTLPSSATYCCAASTCHAAATGAVKKDVQTRGTNTISIQQFESRLNESNTSPPTPSPPPQTVNDVFKEMPKLTPQPRLRERMCTTATSPILLLPTDEPQDVAHQSLHQFCQRMDDPPMTLLQILQSSGSRGMSMLEYYKRHQHLTNTHRTLLIHLIVSFFENHDYHLSLNMSHNLESQILKLFPSEKLENFRTEKRGKIYVKFCNMKRYRREKSHKRKWDGVVVNPENIVPDVDCTTVDEDDFAITFDNWAEQERLDDVRVKTENLSEDGY